MNSQPVQVPDDTPRYADRFLPVMGAVFGLALSLFLATPNDEPLLRVPAFFGAWFLGLLLPRLYRHRYRMLGFVPLMTTIGALLVAIVQLAFDWEPYTIAAFTLVEGAACGAILRYRDLFRDRPRRFLVTAALAALVGIAIIAAYIGIGHAAEDWATIYRWSLLAVSTGLAILAWTTLLRPTIELGVDMTLGFGYRLRAKGPAAANFPMKGPSLVIANHASWFDPMILAVFIPPPIIPMMTSGFYDLPVIRWLMFRVFRTIRVPESTARRDAPEIQAAVQALDAGRCVVIFPEGYLRRKDEQIIRRFGQGVWQILKARPQTPVVACWLEGVWGSYFSHFNGPPTKNKKIDLRRPVTIGMSAPEVVPEDMLSEHLIARIYLMNKVLDARAHLGLADVPRVELPSRGEEDEGTREKGEGRGERGQETGDKG